MRSGLVEPLRHLMLASLPAEPGCAGPRSGAAPWSWAAQTEYILALLGRMKPWPRLGWNHLRVPPAMAAASFTAPSAVNGYFAAEYGEPAPRPPAGPFPSAGLPPLPRAAGVSVPAPPALHLALPPPS